MSGWREWLPGRITWILLIYACLLLCSGAYLNNYKSEYGPSDIDIPISRVAPTDLHIGDASHDIITGPGINNDLVGKDGFVNRTLRHTENLSAIDIAISNLVSGHIAFNAPDKTIMGKSIVVEARLSVTKTPSALIAELIGPGSSEAATLRVGDKMAASLIGGDAFSVSPSGPQVQLTSHRYTTVWTWTITPKQQGKQELVLSIDAILTIDGKEGNRTENTLRRLIDVEVGWPETASEWIEYVKRMFDGVSWIWATLLIPIGTYVAGIWSRKRPHPSNAVSPAHAQRKKHQRGAGS